MAFADIIARARAQTEANRLNLVSRGVLKPTASDVAKKKAATPKKKAATPKRNKNLTREQRIAQEYNKRLAEAQKEALTPQRGISAFLASTRRQPINAQAIRDAAVQKVDAEIKTEQREALVKQAQSSPTAKKLAEQGAPDHVIKLGIKWDKNGTVSRSDYEAMFNATTKWRRDAGIGGTAAGNTLKVTNTINKKRFEDATGVSSPLEAKSIASVGKKLIESGISTAPTKSGISKVAGATLGTAAKGTKAGIEQAAKVVTGTVSKVAEETGAKAVAKEVKKEAGKAAKVAQQVKKRAQQTALKVLEEQVKAGNKIAEKTGAKKAVKETGKAAGNVADVVDKPLAEVAKAVVGTGAQVANEAIATAEEAAAKVAKPVAETAKKAMEEQIPILPFMLPVGGPTISGKGVLDKTGDVIAKGTGSDSKPKPAPRPGDIGIRENYFSRGLIKTARKEFAQGGRNLLAGTQFETKGATEAARKSQAQKSGALSELSKYGASQATLRSLFRDTSNNTASIQELVKKKQKARQENIRTVGQASQSRIAQARARAFF